MNRNTEFIDVKYQGYSFTIVVRDAEVYLGSISHCNDMSIDGILKYTKALQELTLHMAKLKG